MKIKQMARYMLRITLPIMAIFYVVIVAFVAVITLILRLYSIQGTVGTDLSSMAFLFVIGVISFYNFLRVGFSCSISRKTVFVSMLVSGLILSLIAGVAETIIAWAVYLFGLHNSSNLLALGTASLGNAHPVLASLTLFVYATFTSCLGIFAGFFVGGLYYRMNTMLKVLVSVGVPVLFMVVLPFVLFNVGESPVGVEFTNWLRSLSFALFASPLNQILLCAALTAASLGFAWLLIRKAPAKDK